MIDRKVFLLSKVTQAVMISIAGSLIAGFFILAFSGVGSLWSMVLVPLALIPAGIFLILKWLGPDEHPDVSKLEYRVWSFIVISYLGCLIVAIGSSIYFIVTVGQPFSWAQPFIPIASVAVMLLTDMYGRRLLRRAGS